MEQERQRRKGGVEVCPRASSEDEFFFSSSDTIQLELSGVFRIAIPLFGWLLLLFISLFRSFSSYTCQSSRPILECTSPQPFFLAFREQLWPPLRCPGVTSTSTGSECQLCVFNTEVMAPPGVVSPPSPYSQPIGPEISLAILGWTALGDMASFSPMLMACRGYDCLRPYNLEAWALSICPQSFLTLRRGPWT